MDLQDPEGKMGKTGSTEQGTVLIMDPADTVRAKFKTAVTDSGREVQHSEDKAGISNLIEIMTVATGETIPEVEARFDGQGYGAFKEAVAEAVIELLAPVQRRYEEIHADEPELMRMLARGAEKAREAAAPTLEAIYERMGFVRPR
jgi:tryptophanyl-tRNA synthetase